ncbi:MAG: hypothetical protein MUC80_00385 [Candidatus Thermoplasmatota archaeon]|nr:hypothetical protein [Candidatus Thermoplasmatota archaeon]
MAQNYSGRTSFEIWKDKLFTFHFFSSARSAEGMLKSQLRSVYPQCEVYLSKTNLPEIKEGEFVSTCSLVLHGTELNLRCPEDFRYDPLRHVLEAMNAGDTKSFVQVLFERMRRIPKKKMVVLAQKYGEAIEKGARIPLLRCAILIAGISSDAFRARESVEHVARVFSVFDSERCRFVPRFNVLVNSPWRMLKSMNARRFSLFSGFMVSVPELASFVHLPVGAESCGVRYAEPSLSPW